MEQVDQDRVFEHAGAPALSGAGRTFESCTFLGCDLSYADLSGQLFIDCLFRDCNLSLARVANTGFQDTGFRNCKITGADFSQCRDFGLSFSFSGCILDYSVFHGKKLKNIRFEDCSLIECDFTQADLMKASFIQCRLDRAVFSRTNLSGADFTSASGFSIDPENNRMTKARFSAGSLAGLLDKYGLVIR